MQSNVTCTLFHHIANHIKSLPSKLGAQTGFHGHMPYIGSFPLNSVFVPRIASPWLWYFCIISSSFQRPAFLQSRTVAWHLPAHWHPVRRRPCGVTPVPFMYSPELGSLWHGVYLPARNHFQLELAATNHWQSPISMNSLCKFSDHDRTDRFLPLAASGLPSSRWYIGPFLMPLTESQRSNHNIGQYFGST